MSSHVLALVAVATELSHQIERLETELAALLNQHPEAEIIRSIPGLGTKLGARLLGEFGDAPDRFPDARSRKNDAGTSPITKASGRSHVVIARRIRNSRLADTCHQWAFTAISHSPGAPTFYDERRKATATTGLSEPYRIGSSASPTAASPTTHPLRRTHRLGTPLPPHPLTFLRVGCLRPEES